MLVELWGEITQVRRQHSAQGQPVAVVGAGLRGEYDSGAGVIGTGRIMGISRIVQGLIRDFQGKQLAWVDAAQGAWRDAKLDRVDGDRPQKAAPLGHRAAARRALRELGRVVDRGIPPFGGHLGGLVLAAEDRIPEAVRVSRSGEHARHAHDRDTQRRSGEVTLAEGGVPVPDASYVGMLGHVPLLVVSGQSRSLDQAPERDAAHGIKPEGQSTPSCFPRPGAIAIPGTAGGQPVVTALGQLATDARFPPPDRAVVPSGSRWSEADGETGLPAVCCHSLVIPDPLPAPGTGLAGRVAPPPFVTACQKDCSLVPWIRGCSSQRLLTPPWIRGCAARVQSMMSVF